MREITDAWKTVEESFDLAFGAAAFSLFGLPLFNQLRHLILFETLGLFDRVQLILLWLSLNFELVFYLFYRQQRFLAQIQDHLPLVSAFHVQKANIFDGLDDTTHNKVPLTSEIDLRNGLKLVILEHVNVVEQKIQLELFSKDSGTVNGLFH